MTRKEIFDKAAEDARELQLTTSDMRRNLVDDIDLTGHAFRCDQENDLTPHLLKIFTRIAASGVAIMRVEGAREWKSGQQWGKADEQIFAAIDNLREYEDAFVKECGRKQVYTLPEEVLSLSLYRKHNDMNTLGITSIAVRALEHHKK